MKVQGNLFAAMDTPCGFERFDALLQHQGVRIERIVSNQYKDDPPVWYEQDGSEWVIVVSGNAQLEFESGRVDLKAGDYILIEAGQRHRVVSTDENEPTVWLALHWDSDSSSIRS